jgi:hypothetical protein
VKIYNIYLNKKNKLGTLPTMRLSQPRNLMKMKAILKKIIEFKVQGLIKSNKNRINN